jgi:Tfp pilus assembly protein PilO
MTAAQLQLQSLQSLDPRQMRLIGIGLIGLLLAAMLLYLVLPQWRAYQATSASLALMRQGAADGSSLETQLNTLRADVTRLERTLNGDASSLPTKQMEAFVIGRLQTISWRNEMILVSVQPREGMPLNEFRELVFDVELRGGYFDFFDWLQNIDEELGFVVVKRFEMLRSNSGRDTDSPALQIKLTMAAYRNAS